MLSIIIILVHLLVTHLCYRDLVLHIFMTQFRRLPVVGFRIFVPLRKWTFGAGYIITQLLFFSHFFFNFRVRKYAKFGVFYAKIDQMTPQRLRSESLRLQKFSVTNREPLRLQKFSVTHTVLSLPFSQQMQFTLIVNVANLN